MATNATVINDNQLGSDISTNGIFGNLTPGGAFSNQPIYYTYNPTQNSSAKLTLTLQKVKDSIKKQLVTEDGSGADTSDSLVESFLYEFTSLLIDYRDLRNYVFFGSAYTELSYNIKYIIDNFPYQYLISTLTTDLETSNAEFTIQNDTANNQTIILVQQSAIKDCIEEFNFYDNDLSFSWLNYDLIDAQGRRYPITKVITPYDAQGTIFDIDSITTASEIDPLTLASYNTLQVNLLVPSNYTLGQGVNIFESIISDGDDIDTIDDNYVISKIISSTSFEIVNKYAGLKISQNNFDLALDAVSIPVGFSINSPGRIRKVPLAENIQPYTVKIIISGNFTISQFLTYSDDLNNNYSGFLIGSKQETITDWDYNLNPIQKMLLSPVLINPTPWPRRNITGNIQHLLEDSIYNPSEPAFINWLQSPTNSFIQGPTDEDDDYAFSDPYQEYRLVRALALDETETNNLLRRCIPQDVISELNDTENGYFQRFILIAGWLFDQIYVYIKFIKYTHTLNYGDFNQLSPQYYHLLASYYGFTLFDDNSIDFSQLVIQTEPGYYFTNQNNPVDTTSNYYRFTLQQLQYEKQKRLLLSLFYLYKTKGTPFAIKKLVSLLGAPEGLFVFNEYSFEIENTDSFDYYDIATLKGVRTIDNSKIYVPDTIFEIDPDYPVAPGQPPVYRRRLSNESQMNLRMASVQTNPNGAIDYQIINSFGVQKYNYAKFNRGEFATLQSQNTDYTLQNPYQALPLTIPDKFFGFTIEYMIPRTGFVKGVGNNLDEASIHICSLFQLSNETVPTIISNIYTYPLPEVFSNYDYASVRTEASDTTFATDDEPNIESDFNTLDRFFDTNQSLSMTKPYIICRAEGKDLVIRMRVTSENGGGDGERVGILENIFENDGLNHDLRVIFRAEGFEVYKDYTHKPSINSNNIGIALWRDPISSSDGIPYCAFEIPKTKIYTTEFKVYDDNVFVAVPNNEGPDYPKYWDVFIGLPINFDFYFKKIEIFENYSVDSFDIQDELLNNENYTAEYYSFDFSNNSGDTNDISIKCEFSEIEPNIEPADYSFILPVEAFNDLIVIQNLNLTSKTFTNLSTTKYFNIQQDFFNIQNDIFTENAYQKNIHSSYEYWNFNGKLNDLYLIYSPQVLTYNDLAGFLGLIENQLKSVIEGFIPIVINISEFGRLITNSVFTQPKVRYTNIEKLCVGNYIGIYSSTQVRIYDPVNEIIHGNNLTFNLLNKDLSNLIPTITINWDDSSIKTLYDVLSAFRSPSTNPYSKYIIPTLNDDLFVLQINSNWYDTTFGLDNNDITLKISDGVNTIISKFNYGYPPLLSNSDACGSITYSVPVIPSNNIYIYFADEAQPEKYIYFDSENGTNTYLDF